MGEGDRIMKWLTLCLAVAGLSTVAYAAPQPAMSTIPQAQRGDYVQLAQNTCPPPKVIDPKTGACICPPGVACTPPCPPPKVLNAAGQCVCPPGTYQTQTAKICIKCQTPKIVNPAGQCVCPPGTIPTARGQCVKCPPPKVVGPNGQCICPPGTHQSAAANICIPNCPPPKVMNAAGQCVCPPGTHPSPVAANLCVKN